MIKVLKWVYNRGREHERLRLKRIATEFMRDAEVKRAHMRSIEHENAVNAEVSDILARMIYPDYTTQAVKYEPAPIDKEDV